jgi:Uma2 family endonuclease
MSIDTAVRRWTYDEFARLPDDGNRYEIIAGDLYVTPAPTLIHQRIVTRLVGTLDSFVREYSLGELFVGPVDVLFAEGDYLEPDLAFVRADRTAILKERGIEGAPDLVIEVVSPSTAGRDRTLKRERYAAYGVAEYWVVDANTRRVEIYRGFDAAEIATESFTWKPVEGGPELRIQVADLLR